MENEKRTSGEDQKLRGAEVNPPTLKLWHDREKRG
jgi:hypothetical protein